MGHVQQLLPDARSIAELKDNPERCARANCLLDDGGQAVREAMVHLLVPHLLDLSLSECGCRVAQRLIEVLGPTEREDAMKQFHGKVKDLYASRYGNYVLAKVVEVLPCQKVVFIIQELLGSVATAARHRYGCRVLERLIEHCPQIEGLVDEIVAEAEALSKHQFGNFVVKRLLEHGREPWRDRVVEPLLGSLAALAKHRSASHVVQQAWLVSDGRRQMQMVDALLSAESPTLVELACTRYGSYVVEELISLPNDIVRLRLMSGLDTLKSSEFGRRVAERFGFIERQPPFSDDDNASARSSLPSQ